MCLICPGNRKLEIHMDDTVLARYQASNRYLGNSHCLAAGRKPLWALQMKLAGELGVQSLPLLTSKEIPV
jgi:hypothetical protein